MKKERVHFYIQRNSFPAAASAVCMVLSFLFRLCGYADRWDDTLFSFTQIILPGAASVLMILVIIIFGKTRIWLSSIPVLLGVVSFAFKLFLDPRYHTILHHVLCCILYSCIVLFWIITMDGIIRTKWPLLITFMIPLLVHIYIEDVPVILGTGSPLSRSQWLQEGGMICIMLGLIFFIIGMKTEELVK